MNTRSSIHEPEERARIKRMLQFEREYWRDGLRVAGLDEAGRGPLAGPVLAAAVVFHESPEIANINDSKKLSESKRESLFTQIQQTALCSAVGIASVAEIDRINIFQASVLAMQRALSGLDPKPHHLLIDGRYFPTFEVPHTTLVKGDSRSYSIAAASILAKVTRDRIMVEYDREFPQYGFASHKGYATREHLDAIDNYGFCAVHRRSFHPKRFLPTTLSLFDDEDFND